MTSLQTFLPLPIYTFLEPCFEQLFTQSLPNQCRRKNVSPRSLLMMTRLMERSRRPPARRRR